MIVEFMNEKFISEAKASKELDIAVALITDKQAKQIIDLAQKDHINVRLIVGIDLPTPNSALKILMEANRKDKLLNVRYYDGLKIFHPKVYLFRKTKKNVAFVGSANFTKKGFSENCELSLETRDSGNLKEIDKWFDDLWENHSSKITQTLIESREKMYKDCKYKPIPSMKNVKKDCDVLNKLNLNELKVLRNDKQIYKEICTMQKKNVSYLRKLLDSKNGFKNFSKEAVDDFCRFGTLGRLNFFGLLKSMHNAEKNGTLRRMCKMLDDESLPIEDRFAASMKMIKGISNGTICKILTALHPKKYILLNGCSAEYLKLHKTINGKKYKEYCRLGQMILKELDVDNFAILDGLIRQALKKDML